jgi:iron-sulfur cluster repair protein YtfE (RIC family)
MSILQVERVYTASSEAEREREGQRLQGAITTFLDEFLVHMDEEEKIFTPLLDENFEEEVKIGI